MTTSTHGLPELVVLLGRDHPRTGEAASASVGPAAAVAMTAGATAKDPPSLDPNEDAGAVARGAEATLVVVADGHFGLEGSEAAVDYLLAAIGADPPAIVAAEKLALLFFEAGIAVQREQSHPGTTHPESHTSLALALVSSDSVRWAAFGDSCVVLVSAEEAITLNSPRSVYLGTRFTLGEVGQALEQGSVDLDEGDAVVLATDGLGRALTRAEMEFAPSVWRHTRSARDAREAAESLVALALDLGVDDAVTTAVVLSTARRVR